MIHVMKNMKNPETCHQDRKPPVTTQFNRFRVRFIATVCAAIAACFVLTGHAANLLVNPGFETGSFSGWTAHTTESWSMGANNVMLTHSGSWCLLMQGLYGNGGAPVPYTSYAYQTFACTPGSLFTADGWFSQYVYENPPHPSDGSPSLGGVYSPDCLFGAAFPGVPGGPTEDGWIEVLFLTSTTVGITNNILAIYRSTIIDPAYVNNLANSGATVTNIVPGPAPTGSTNIWLIWGDFPVTNQYDISTISGNVNADPDTDAAGITNTLGPGQYMTAPPGTKYVQLRVCLDQVGADANGAPNWDDFTLIQYGGQSASVIGSISPNGFFNMASTNFTFKVTSASTGGYPLATNQTSGIQVLVSTGGGPFTDVSGSLQFSGTPTNLNVTYPGPLLASAVYNISISVSNTAGLVSSASVAFDTFPTNCFIVSSEDYDFTNGMFFENPIPTSVPGPNSYTGLGGVWGVDMDTYGAVGALPGGSVQLVRADGCVAFQVAPDIQLPLYLAQSNPAVVNVSIAYNNAGNWENYTRIYPSNYCKVYARMSAGAVPDAGIEYLNLLTSGYGTTNQTTNLLGEFYLPPGSDGTHCYWIPLTYGTSGNLVSLILPPGTNTLQLLSGGGCNFDFFILVPLSGPLGIPPFFANVNMAAQPVFGSGISNVTYSVYSLTSFITTNQIYTYLNGQNVSSTATYTMVGAGNTNWTVSVPVQQNQVYSLVLGAVDAAGLTNSTVPLAFDTFSQNNFMFEAEDFDFNGGQFITNPIPTGAYVGALVASYAYSAANSYFWNPALSGTEAIDGVDLTTVGPSSVGGPDAGELELYRPNADAGTEVTTDFLRNKFYVTNGVTVTIFSDFDVGWWDPGQWLNYTRIFPTNTYNVYGRLASIGAYSGLSLSLVTSGVGTPTQTTNLLGTFSDPNANGWQDWDWVPLLNTNGQMAVVSLGGTNTLQVNNTTAGRVNANFYMLVPAVVAPQAVHLSVSRTGSTISIQFPTQSGFSYTVLYSGSLHPANWLTLTTISGDGTVKTATDTMGSSPRFYRVLAQ